MLFESKAFMFDKTPTGRIVCNPKTKIHQALKGFSTDLLDNIIMRTGTAYSICYEQLSKMSGFDKPRFSAKDLMSYVNVDNEYKEVKDKRMTMNSDKILNMLSGI